VSAPLIAGSPMLGEIGLDYLFAVRRAIVHWYSGPQDVFAAMAARGCWFSFGIATIHSEEIQALARLAPLDRLLTETDGPGCLRLFTGETGMPHHMLGVLDALAGLRGLTVAELQDTVATNWRRLVAGDERLAPWASW
jgi:TatD DNase family protein